MEIVRDILCMKKRPKMFFKNETVKNIYYNLLGSCTSEKRIEECKVDIDTEFVGWFGEWLELWVSSHYTTEDFPRTQYWYKTIRWLAKDEKSACRWFYYLFEIFYEEYKSKAGYFEFLK